jgi:hypothetical protein
MEDMKRKKIEIQSNRKERCPMKIRKAVFAGSWYPSDARSCERQIETFLNEGKMHGLKGKTLIAGIVPHAGWFFSGSIACNVIHAISQAGPADVVLIFGMHLHPGSTPHIMPAGGWETPFGSLEVEESLAHDLSLQYKFKIETPERFAQDNTIELQLPFIKYFFKNARILGMGVPPAEISLEIAQKAVALAGKQGLRTKVIGSTDLTHYGFNYGFTPKGTGPDALDWVRKENDQRFIKAMLSMDPGTVIQEGLKNHNACCAGAAGAALAAAKSLGAERGELFAYATSYDRHPNDSFVGYAGVVFE